MVVELNNIKNEILNDISFNLKENEITSIIGKNNSGKTLILDMIYCLNFDYSGNITINEKKLDKESKLNVRNDIFYLMNDLDKLLFNINIREDIKYVVDKLDEKKLEELFKLFDLDITILDKSYLEISNTEKKKVLLVIAFLSNKKILLLDNPTLYLDYKSKQSLIKLLKRNKKEKIILIVSMDTNFLLNVSNRVIVINDKKIVLDDNKYKVFENKSLLDKIGLKQPEICNFKNKVKVEKNINLSNSDNINDLLKDVYRNAK